MSAVRFFTDEDVHGSLPIALRKAGFDAVSTVEVRRQGESDESQLRWSSGEGRVLVTFNVAHFAALHAQWIDRGEHHAGIVVARQHSVGDTLRRLMRLANDVDAEAMRDRIEFLGNW